MRALVCEEFGPPDHLILKDVAVPNPGNKEVRIQVAAVGLNFFDTLIIQDKYQVKATPPFSPGGECVGIVDAVGDDTSNLNVGDRVIAYVPFGACAEYVIAEASKVTVIDDRVSDEIAAGLSITYGTTIHALKDRARLASGEILAVLGASGGVGLAAVELGKAMGARVIACASSDEKLKIAGLHGADDGLNYARSDLKQGLKALAGPKGVDVVYDPVGGDLAEAALRALGWKGRFLVIGFAGGQIPKIPLNLALLKGCDILGVFWGRFLEEEPNRARENMRQLVDLCVEGQLTPRIDQVLPLERAIEGLNRLKNRQANGKIIVRP